MDFSGSRLCKRGPEACFHSVERGAAEAPQAGTAGPVAVVDVSALFSGCAEGRRHVVRLLHESCCEGASGFIAVGHAIPPDLIQSALSSAKSFFGMGEELKAKYRSCGFDPVGDVAIAIRPSALHERLVFPSREGSRSDFQDTPGLPAALSSLREHYRRLALQLLGALAEGLGWQAQALAGPSAGSTTPIVALHYPAVARADVPAADGHAGAQELGAAMRAYPHADGDSVLTLLAHENVAGLQVLVRGASVEDDRWADVPEVPGGITVQLGQMLQRWTDDRLLATPHRVVLRPGAEGSSAYPARLTLAYFFQPPPDTALSPPGGGAVYEPVTAADFSKMARTDSEGRSLKLTSNILKDGLWVGQRGGGRRGPPDVPG